LETGRAGFGCDRQETLPTISQIRSHLRTPNPDRVFAIYQAFKLGLTAEDIHELTAIDIWFLDKLQELVETEKFLKQHPLPTLTADQLWAIKQQGFSDRQIAFATKTTEDEMRKHRKSLGVIPVYK
ncbi:MAG: carbamoyl phosphate synthase large subunit, partial [Microcystaceae cyanobacterium]